MGEVQNEKRLEVMHPTGKKKIMNKVITLDLLINNIIFTQQCSVLPITNLIILGSNFLHINFAVLNIGDCTVASHFTNYMLNNSLTHDPVHD